MVAVESDSADDYEQTVNYGPEVQRFTRRLHVWQEMGCSSNARWCLGSEPSARWWRCVARTDVAGAPLWWRLPGDPWEPPPPPPPEPSPPQPAAPPAAAVLRPRPRPVLGCHRNEVTPSPLPTPTRSPLCWQWGYRWPRRWVPQAEPRTPIPPAGTYSGPRIVYDSAFLLQLRNSPLSQKPPKDLASFPNDIVKGTNASSSEETPTGSQLSPSPPSQQ
ncbi:WAS/WASL-interacting protein family member 3-like isoform X2 [Schistocerca gregaria]|uniref:WAS/WASL-interacting protein family member 3-like isoform X2 n=1 Tax=Schistocerca gregaria TaxID=7010 RepID=UPI00211E3322|nr:WAS/WASL-interacting protein family member 3-like isoform X2 [Schistocerca gregaria]